MLSDYRLFFQEFRRNFHSTGSIAPSSRWLAGALSRYVAAGTGPQKILEVGPGTGAVTQRLVRVLGFQDHLDLVELNEAFAAQVLATLRAIGIADGDERVNPNGGAIALGHPLGMSGARLVGTAALELKDRNARTALAAMCIGVGQGIAVLLTPA